MSEVNVHVLDIILFLELPKKIVLLKHPLGKILNFNNPIIELSDLVSDK
jgi:hypothetical protein